MFFYAFLIIAEIKKRNMFSFSVLFVIKHKCKFLYLHFDYLHVALLEDRDRMIPLAAGRNVK